MQQLDLIQEHANEFKDKNVVVVQSNCIFCKWII